MKTLAKLFDEVDVGPYPNGAYCYRVEDDILYIYFQGSASKEDWQNNFDFPAKPYKSMQDTWHVHRGFLKEWKVIRDEIEDMVLTSPVKHIVVVGYSHGGPLAGLCVEWCCFNRPDCLVEGYAFGCPRFVWGHLPSAVAARFANFLVIRDHTDIVTHVPPAIFGFHHVGNFLKVGRHKKWNPVQSHMPSSYRESLEDYHNETGN